eukprot:6529367-Alexandrium_andersonii.AAC.1
MSTTASEPESSPKTPSSPSSPSLPPTSLRQRKTSSTYWWPRGPTWPAGAPRGSPCGPAWPARASW